VIQERRGPLISTAKNQEVAAPARIGFLEHLESVPPVAPSFLRILFVSLREMGLLSVDPAQAGSHDGLRCFCQFSR
jgi:hypothetical protein